MKADPLIKSIRDVRHEISKQFNHDVDKIINYYKNKQEKHSDRLIDSQPLIEKQKLAS